MLVIVLHCHGICPDNDAQRAMSMSWRSIDSFLDWESFRYDLASQSACVTSLGSRPVLCKIFEFSSTLHSTCPYPISFMHKHLHKKKYLVVEQLFTVLDNSRIIQKIKDGHSRQSICKDVAKTLSTLVRATSIQGSHVSRRAGNPLEHRPHLL